MKGSSDTEEKTDGNDLGEGLLNAEEKEKERAKLLEEKKKAGDAKI